MDFHMDEQLIKIIKFHLIVNHPIDNDKSRRVEFRIVTTSEAIINEALKNIEAK
jgi:hypothetical protein